MKDSLVMIVGPTASGKSSLAMKLAQKHDAEIVSIDSVQIYKGLDIGSAKPSKLERQKVGHHLIDVFEPDEQCNVARFIELADAAIADITSRGKRAIAVGGTNLYVRGLRFGVFDAPPSDPELRSQHRQIVDEFGVEKLHQELQEVDPESANRIHPNDIVRTSRALEVFALTGKTMTALQTEHGFKTEKFRTKIIALQHDRDRLYARINKRVDEMIEEGLEEEYAHIVGAGYSPELPSLNALGYRHMNMVQQGTPREEAIELLKRDTRRFAKQQLSWLRGESDVEWHTGESAIEAVEAFWTAVEQK